MKLAPDAPHLGMADIAYESRPNLNLGTLGWQLRHERAHAAALELSAGSCAANELVLATWLP